MDREAELAVLARELRASACGRSRLVVVEGPPGIGKTSLVREFRGAAHVLHVRGDELERDYPFGVVRQLLHDPDQLPADVESALHTALASRATTVLVVDDWDAVDEPSRNLLAALDAPPLRVFLRRTPTPPGADAVVLRPGLLTEAGTAALTGPALAPVCHALTGGNPQLLHLLRGALGEAASLDRPTTQRYAAAVVDWLTGLPPALRAAAHTAAVTGEGSGELVAMGLLRADGRWTHPDLRDAVYAGIPRPERATLHRRTAEHLTTTGAPADRIAAHLARLPPAGDERVVAGLRTAAHEAVTRGEPETAAELLRRALEEPPADRLDVLVELGRCEAVTRPAAAIRHLSQALPDLDLARLGEVAGLLGHCLVRETRVDEAVALLDKVAAQLTETDRETALVLRARRLVLAALHERTAARYPAAADLAEGHTGATPGERALLGAVAFSASFTSGPAKELADLASRSLHEDVPLLGDLITTGPLWVLLWAGEHRAAAKASQATLTHARIHGTPLDVGVALSCVAGVSCAEGDLTTAATAAREAMTLLPRGGYPMIVAAGVYAETLVELANPAEALAVLADLDHPHDDSFQYAYLHYARGRGLLAANRPEEALAELLDCGRRHTRLGNRNPAMSDWRGWTVRAHLALGHRQEARTLADEALALANHWHTPHTRGTALRAQALATGGPTALDLLHESTAELRQAGTPLDLARTLLDLAEAQHAAAQTRLARRHSTEALTIAETHGATALATTARDLLATTARPRRRDRTGPPRLTPAEHRVAELAAAGHTNPQIAEALSLTRRTVEGHLTAAYRKLGIPGRAALRDRLG